jgi:hypothetical protein
MAELSHAVFENSEIGRVELILHRKGSHFYLQSITNTKSGEHKRDEKHLSESAESRAKAAFAKAVDDLKSKGLACIEEASV